MLLLITYHLWIWEKGKRWTSSRDKHPSLPEAEGNQNFKPWKTDKMTPIWHLTRATAARISWEVQSEEGQLLKSRLSSPKEAPAFLALTKILQTSHPPKTTKFAPLPKWRVRGVWQAMSISSWVRIHRANSSSIAHFTPKMHEIWIKTRLVDRIYLISLIW